MRVKNYLVNNLSQIAKTIKADLGESAVILNTKQLEDGRYEVIAGADPEIGRGSQRHKTKPTNNYANLSSNKKSKVVDFAANKSPKTNSNGKINMLPEILKQVLFILNNSGMTTDSAITFVRRYCASWEKYDDPEKLLRDSLERSLQTIGEIPDGSHFFIGYPGEGKTSLIMKAAFHIRESGRRVAILNLDHTKIGAGDDLEKFAGWSGFGFLNIDDLSDLSRLRQVGVICLIDTPGNLTYEMITSEPFKTGNIHLVCDVTRNLPGQIWREQKSRNNYLALTKLDYLNEPGKIIEKFVEVQRPLSFMSKGPKTPDDFAIFDSHKIANMILGSNENKGNLFTSWMNKLQKIRKSS
ncbi:MAG: hypothetical protein ACLFSQ_06145 [Candidatus Zixiibacteriota bacterium]